MADKLFDVGETKPIPVPPPEPPPVKIDIAKFSPPLPFESLAGAYFSPDRKYRYLLWRRLKEIGPIISYLGVNPSTADEKDDDPTIRREIGFAKQWGFAVVWAANFFAIRSTDPKKLRWEDDPVGVENDAYLQKVCEESDMIILCCGNWGYLNGRYKKVLEFLSSDEKVKPKLYHLGMTKAGYPRHPLYLSKKVEPTGYYSNIVEGELRSRGLFRNLPVEVEVPL